MAEFFAASVFSAAFHRRSKIQVIASKAPFTTIAFSMLVHLCSYLVLTSATVLSDLFAHSNRVGAYDFISCRESCMDSAFLFEPPSSAGPLCPWGSMILFRLLLLSKDKGFDRRSKRSDPYPGFPVTRLQPKDRFRTPGNASRGRFFWSLRPSPQGAFSGFSPSAFTLSDFSQKTVSPFGEIWMRGNSSGICDLPLQLGTVDLVMSGGKTVS